MKRVILILIFSFLTLFGANKDILNPNSEVYDFTFQSNNVPLEEFSQGSYVNKISVEVDKIIGSLPRFFKTNTCGTDTYGNNYCKEALSECSQEWDYEDGYSVANIGSVVDYTNKITTTEEVCSTNTGVRMYSNCAALHMFYSNASSYCSNLVEGGYNDWRLPTLGETATSSGMGGNGVPSCGGWTWTSTTSFYGFNERWTWSGSSLNSNDINYGYSGNRVRCVR